MTFNTKLKALRKKNRMTQKDLAENLEVALSTVAMWETANREPDIAMLKKISDFFDISIEVLLDDSMSVDDSGQIFIGQGEVRTTYDDLRDIRRLLHDRPEMQMLFSVTKNASKEDIERAVKIIEALKESSQQ